MFCAFKLLQWFPVSEPTRPYKKNDPYVTFTVQFNITGTRLLCEEGGYTGFHELSIDDQLLTNPNS